MTRRHRDIVRRFSERYSQPAVEATLAVEREVIGANVGASGYTTVAQADSLVDQLRLGTGRRLLDIGAGRGWPGLYLAEKTGCEVVLTDVPAAGLVSAQRRADKRGLSHAVLLLRAAGQQLPFQRRSFDAVVHTDTL